MPTLLASLASGFALLAVAGTALGQCQFTTVGVQNYGTACNPVFGAPPSIAAALDPVACTLGIRVTAFGGCCNTYLRDRVLVLGDAPQNLPLPQIGSGCTLLVNPLVFVWQPVAAGDTFTLSIPPTITGFTFYAQGAAHYFTTIGFSNDLALTDGVALTLQ